MESLFGTDGIRGQANRHPMTPEMMLRVGRAAAAVLARSHRSRMIIGKDGRLSGDMIEAALAAGICSAGTGVYAAGLLPTPAVAFLARHKGADAGIMVSASHNPFEDNGVKIFDKDGFKLDAGVEKRIEDLVRGEDRGDLEPAVPDAIGDVRPLPGAKDAYVSFLQKCLQPGTDLKGLRLVLDCSNGAASEIAPRVFSGLGADVRVLFDSPDGTNINAGCGSQHIGPLQRAVVEARADAGLAFDGDADRLIAVDETGQAVTGDHILAICARHLKQAGRLKNNLVVSTVMSNVGLINALKQMGIEHRVTGVGDRQVLDRMRKSGAVLGGEDSGHMIFLDDHSSGDGILTGLRLLEAMIHAKEPLSALRGLVRLFPQVLKNVWIREKVDIYQFPEIAGAIERVRRHLGDSGRVLVRYSGTQPLCRIMVEGPEAQETDRLCQDIVDAVAARLGA